MSKPAKPPADPPAPPPPPDVGRDLLALLVKASAEDLAAIDARAAELERDLAAVREVRKLVAARLGLTPKPGPKKPKAAKADAPAADGRARQPDPNRPNAPVRRGLVGAAETKVAAYLARVGPKKLEEIKLGAGVEAAHAQSALRCDWFAVDVDGRYALTPRGRQEALDE